MLTLDRYLKMKIGAAVFVFGAFALFGVSIASEQRKDALRLAKSQAATTILTARVATSQRPSTAPNLGFLSILFVLSASLTRQTNTYALAAIPTNVLQST